MGSLIDGLQRREAAAGAEAARLGGQIAELAEGVAGVEEQLSRLAIARDVVDEVLAARPPRRCHRGRDIRRWRLRGGLAVRL